MSVSKESLMKIVIAVLGLLILVAVALVVYPVNSRAPTGGAHLLRVERSDSMAAVMKKAMAENGNSTQGVEILVEDQAFPLPIMRGMSPRADFVFPDKTIRVPDKYSVLSPGKAWPAGVFAVLVMKQNDTVDSYVNMLKSLPEKTDWVMVVTLGDTYDDPFVEVEEESLSP
jgi:hypothetical protein